MAMARQMIDRVMIAALRNVKGIVNSCPLPNDDHPRILEIEIVAGKRSLMGLGKVLNTGVREISNHDLVYAALTSKDFDCGCYSTLLLKKGQEIVNKRSGMKRCWPNWPTRKISDFYIKIL